MLTPYTHATLNAMKGLPIVEYTKGEQALLAAAAHELKSPLILVQQIANTLTDTAVQLTPSEQNDYLQRLQFTSDRMLRLVQQLAISYRLEDERQLAFQFGLEPLNSLEVCEGVLHELTPYAKQHHQTLQLQPDRCQHLALANREILHDIVVNLVDNAIRHNPPGGNITVSAGRRADQVRISVRDQGGGVAKSEFSQLRRTLGVQPQPFQGRSATSGLGLYIVGQFVAAMGGSLGLGRAAQGSHFFVDLMRSKQMSLL